MLSDVVSESPTKKFRSLNAAIINTAYNVNLAAKLTITQEEGLFAYSTTHVEESLTETPESPTKFSTKYMPQKRKATMMASSKSQNYHIHDILYNIYKDNIFHYKKDIKSVSITAPYFIKYTAKFGHCMELIDAVVNPDHILISKKQLDKGTLMSSAS